MAFASELAGIALAGHPNDVVLDGHIVRGQIVESGRRGGCSIVKGETRVMPRAADCLAYQHALVERSSVMGTLPANGYPVRLDVREQNRFSESVTADHLTRFDAADLDPLDEIGTRQLIGMF